MKKLIGIVVLGLLFSGNTFAQNVHLSCESIIQNKISIIINDKTKKFTLEGVEVEVVNWSSNYITFWKNDLEKKLSLESSRKNWSKTGTYLVKPSVLDRITGTYGKYNCKIVKGVIKYKILRSAEIVEIGKQKLDELKKEWEDQHIDKDSNMTFPILNNILNANIHEVGLSALDDMGWYLISVSQNEVFYFRKK